MSRCAIFEVCGYTLSSWRPNVLEIFSANTIVCGNKKPVSVRITLGLSRCVARMWSKGMLCPWNDEVVNIRLLEALKCERISTIGSIFLSK
jgi:hypothetical protein